MITEFLILVALPALLVAAAIWDIASFTIPNAIQIALLLGFLLFVAVAHMAVGELGGHGLAGLIGLGIGFTLFALGFIGGGDAKLFACLALWFGMHDIVLYALIATVFGGALTLGLLAARRFPLPRSLTAQGWLLRLHDQGSGIPYGVALAAGAFYILPQAEVFRTAFGA